MADRIGAAGGTLTVRTEPGQGTSVTGWVPVTPGPPPGRAASGSTNPVPGWRPALSLADPAVDPFP
jgi:hypothetical protein